MSDHWYYRKCSDCGVRYRSVMPQILKRELCDPCDLRAEANAVEEMDRLQREARLPSHLRGWVAELRAERVR